MSSTDESMLDDTSNQLKISQDQMETEDSDIFIVEKPRIRRIHDEIVLSSDDENRKDIVRVTRRCEIRNLNKENRSDFISDSRSEVSESKPQRGKLYWSNAAEEAGKRLLGMTLKETLTKRVWKKGTIEKEEKHPEDEEIDIQVREMEDKPVEYWHELTATMEKSKKGFDFDYIIETEPGLTHDKMTIARQVKRRKTPPMVLIKWSGFALPTWNPLTDVNGVQGGGQLRVMMKRMQLMEMLEERLRKEKSEKDATFDFDTAFPHRWITNVEWVGEYVEDERAKYVNRLRAWEWRINFEYKKEFGEEVAPLYVANWVDDVEVPTDKSMKFITKLRPSPMVASVLANTHEMSWVNCNSCAESCTFPREHWNRKPNCCGVNYGLAANHYDGKKFVTRNTDTDKDDDGNAPPHLSNHEIEQSVMVECVDDCKCDKQRCKQRIVQRGRQVPLVIFREDVHKGWGVRAGAAIAAGEFVTEYVGEVVTANEKREKYPNSHYTYAMRLGWAENLEATTRVKRHIQPGARKRIMRGHRSFSIDASDMGNEARYVNHSCEPNLFAVVVYAERHGEFYHRVAFFARKNIELGEELTVDYFPEADAAVARTMFDKCRCGTESCKFVDMGASSDSDSGTDEDIDEPDSFDEDDARYQRQAEEMKNRKKRNEEREKRREEERKKREEEERRKKDRRNGGKKKKEEEKKKFVVSSKYSTGHPETDLLKDPREIMLDRCGGDQKKFNEMWQARMNGGGIFAQFANLPYSAEAHQAMFEKAEASIKKRREEQRRREEEEKRGGGQ